MVKKISRKVNITERVKHIKAGDFRLMAEIPGFYFICKDL
ncbi:hypothetical protein DCCM_3508 [Desulfocucumis palustris]|uniref:Uncharacterized protein n=1 Tax=Desulfocucumis palustris TaxID=1898651 RepID=A0A2L2XDU5_9FIRM|nr:hypothetical protein DCCM_3508 [Desulfocucumis palustris]